jgi:hypothetical protein
MTIKTIHARATVTDRGVLTLEVPVDIEPGEYSVAVTVEDAAAPPSDEEDDWLAKLHPLSLAGWPPGSTFGRDELYDDDGR